jgi:hypothetical protein
VVTGNGGSNRVVGQNWGQPFLDIGQSKLLSPRVIFGLVALDLSYREILRVGVGKVKPAHCRRRPHGVAFGKRDADLSRSEQLEQFTFLGMVGAGRVTRCWSNAAILFADQGVMVQVFIRCIAPELSPHALM